MPPSPSFTMRAKLDSCSESPGDLAFDRPSKNELLDLAISMVDDMASCGFSQKEVEHIVELMEMVARTRHNGRN